jgi:hypothetical protein
MTSSRFLSLGDSERGSALILVLFACLATAVVLQSLTTVLLCAQRAVVDESVGRERLAERDAGLAMLRERALASWQPISWTDVEPGSQLGARVKGTVEELPASGGLMMRAVVAQDPSVSRLTASALVEKGWDGLDLPIAAIVAESLTALPGRDTPWVELDSGDPSALRDSGSETRPTIWTASAPIDPVWGTGCSRGLLSRPWTLDEGWKSLATAASGGTAFPDGQRQGQSSSPAVGLALGLGAISLSSPFGRCEALPEGSVGMAVESPILVMVRGEGALDVRNRGDLYGVIVSEGPVLLDGTVLHGAVFTESNLDLGESGRVCYSQAVLRWATDRSLMRARLVPGTRDEGTQ